MSETPFSKIKPSFLFIAACCALSLAYSPSVRAESAPRWNPTNDKILVPGLAKNKTSQIFMISVVPTGKQAPLMTSK